MGASRCLKRLQDFEGLVSLGGVDSGGFGGASGGRVARPAVRAPGLPLCGKLCLPSRLCRLRRHVPPAASQAVLRLRCVRCDHTAADTAADAAAPLMTTFMFARPTASDTLIIYKNIVPAHLHFVSAAPLLTYIWSTAPLPLCIRAASARVLLRSD